MGRMPCFLAVMALSATAISGVRFRVLSSLVLIPFILLIIAWCVKGASLGQGFRDQAPFIDLWWLAFAIVIGAILEATTFQSFGFGRWWSRMVGASCLQHILFVWLLLMIPLTMLTISSWRRCQEMWARKSPGGALAPRHSLVCSFHAGVSMTIPCTCLCVTCLLFLF